MESRVIFTGTVIMADNLSDQESVLTMWNNPEPELRLMAHSEDAPAKAVYYLTGAIMACGGEMLSRRFHCDGSAALECEFPRGICVEIYGVLLTAGLQLSRSSHLKMAELCLRTHALPEDFQQQVVAMELEVWESETGGGTLARLVESRQIA
jgi:hypothetical protein